MSFIIEKLPEDLIAKIFCLVDIHSLNRSLLVCQGWYRLLNGLAGLWEKLFKIWFVHPDALCNIENYPPLENSLSWKERFLESYDIEKGWTETRFKRTKWATPDKSRVGTQQYSLREGVYVAGSTRGNILLYKIKDFHATHLITYSGHTDAVRGIQFDSEKIVSGSRDKTIQIWDKSPNYYNELDTMTTIKKPKCLISCGDNCNSLMFKENLIAGGFSNGDLRLINMETQTIEQQYTAHNRWVRHIQYTNHTIMTGGADRTILLWDTRTLSQGPIRTYLGHMDTVTAVQFHEDRVLSASDDKTIREWSLSQGTMVQTISQPSGVRSLQFDRQKIVTGSGDWNVNVYDWKKGESKVLAKTYGFVSSVRFYKDLLFVSSSDGQITMFQVTKDKPEMEETKESVPTAVHISDFW